VFGEKCLREGFAFYYAGANMLSNLNTICNFHHLCASGLAPRFVKLPICICLYYSI
jgi:hypothetical protein